MNKDFARRLASAKWVVPVAVLILTLSIGSIAFAVSGSSTPQKDTGASVAAGAGVGASGAVAQAATTTVTTPALVLAVQAAASATGSTPVSVAGAASPDSLAIDQVKENAILDLLRQKMSPADQSTLDQLRAQAAGEQTQLQQVQASLNATTQQIADLVNKYLGITTTTSTAVTAGQ